MQATCAPGARRLAAALLALATACAVHAGTAPPLAFTRVEPLGPDSQSILALQQDRQGFIWIGTIEGGLFRYDGRQARRYGNEPGNPRSLPGGRVASLYGDPQGTLWVGTDEGLARFDPASNGFQRYAPPKASSNALIVRRIVDDGKGGLWLSTWGGLQHFDPGSGEFKVYTNDPSRDDSLASNDTNALAVDDKGGVWVGTWPAGMDYLAPGAKGFQHFRVDSDEAPNPKQNLVRALLVDSTNRLWLGTDVGMVVWKIGSPWSSRRQLAMPQVRITDIDEDRGGDIWISTRTAGIWRWDRDHSQLRQYEHRAEDARSLSSNAINTTMHDRTSTLWVGSFTDGVSRANLAHHGLERMLPRDVAPDVFQSSNFVRSMAAASDGRLWLGVDDGLALYNPATRKVERHYSSGKQAGMLSHNVITSLYQAPQGPLWIATPVGLDRLDSPDGPVRHRAFGSYERNSLNAIAPGRGGILWLATAGGLLRYDPATDSEQALVHEEGNSASRSTTGATTVLEDRHGRVWTGEFLRGGGLDMALPGSSSFTHLRHQPGRMDSLSNDRVTSLLEDADGNLWVGTREGLNKVQVAKDGSIKVRRMAGKGKVGKQMIEALALDRSGMLWVTTAEGLSKFDPVSETEIPFAPEDGLTEGFYLNSAVRAADGKLYFGGTGGITIVNPAVHSSVSRPPQLAITDIRIGNKPLEAGHLPQGVEIDGSLVEPKGLTVPWRTTMLSLEFAALHYAEPRSNSYSYWLEGVDPGWIQADARMPVATYTNLPPGEYRFHLTGSNNKGVPAKAELVLPITVPPPMWQTWWARTALVAVVAAVLAALYRWRVQRLTARTRHLEQVVVERTSGIQALNQQLAALSTTDSLTGVANRRHFDDALAREWRRAARRKEALAVALVDVDLFKSYNDHYGHPAGDVCLRQVGQALAALLRREGDVVARYSGTMFALLAPSCNASDARLLADRWRLAIAALAMPHSSSPFGTVTASIGVVAMVPETGQGPALMLQAADQALQRAKLGGRNRIESADAAPPPAA